MEMQNSIRILRRYLRAHNLLKIFSTQAEFAKMVGCSESLIRAVESGRIAMTLNLKEKIQRATGVQGYWLTEQQVPGAPIPAAEGGQFTHETMLDRIEELKRGTEALIPLKCPKKELARAVGKLVETTLLEMLNRGDTRLIDDIKKLFLQAELIGTNMQHAAEAPLYHDMSDPGPGEDADFQVPDVKIILRNDLRSGGKKCLSKWPESPSGPGFSSKSDAPASTSPLT